MRTFLHCGIIMGLLLLQGVLFITSQFKARRISRGGIFEGKRRIATGLMEGGSFTPGLAGHRVPAFV